MIHPLPGPGGALQVPVQKVTSPGEVLDLTKVPEVIDLSASEEKIVADAWKREESDNREADVYNSFVGVKGYRSYKGYGKI